MILAVGADAMAGIADFADTFGEGLGHAADDEEGRLHALRGENIQNPIAVVRQRPVIERQDHLMIPERQRFGILHGADTGMLPGVDDKGSEGAERAGVTRTIGGECGLCGDAAEQPQA